jgi:hypothetical protein
MTYPSKKIRFIVVLFGVIYFVYTASNDVDGVAKLIKLYAICIAVSLVFIRQAQPPPHNDDDAT